MVAAQVQRDCNMLILPNQNPPRSIPQDHLQSGTFSMKAVSRSGLLHEADPAGVYRPTDRLDSSHKRESCLVQ